MRIVLSGVVLVALLPACLKPDPYQVTQHGAVAPPRAAAYDGQPLGATARVEGHLRTTQISGGEIEPESGAAVTRKELGGALRKRIGPESDLGLELDVGWDATEGTLAGDSSAAMEVPDDAVIGVAVALRRSFEVEGGFRVGLSMALGGQSNPIQRLGFENVARDVSGVVRMALVPSYQLGEVTLFGGAGFSTEADIPETFTVTPDEDDDNDPGVVAEATGVAGTLAVGATLRLGEQLRVSAQASHVMGLKATYGPQIGVTLSLDLGDPPPAPAAAAAR